MDDHQGVKDVLIRVAKEQGFSVLLAVESGSRAWGFASKNSDYDLRFIYYRPVEWYLSLERKKDHCDMFLPGKVDLVGWDIQKALRLMAKSNPGLMDWIFSPCVYYSQRDVHEKLKVLAGQCFCPKTGIHHYLHIGEKIYRGLDPLKEGGLKKSLYLVRSIANCIYIENHRKPPPTNLIQTVRESLEDELVTEMIYDLIRIKKEGRENESVSIPPELLAFLHSGLEYFSRTVRTMPKRGRAPWDELNHFFTELVGVSD